MVVRSLGCIQQPYLDLLSRRPKAIKYSSLYDQFPDVWTRFLKDCTEEEQKDVLRLLGKLLKNNDFTLLNEALSLASANGHPSADQIKHCFYSLLNKGDSHAAIIPRNKVPIMPSVIRGLTHYDAFFHEGGVRE